MLTDIVTNIFNNIINYITGQNAQDRFVNLLDSTPNILSDANQASGYPATDINNEIVSTYYNENDSRANIITMMGLGELVGSKFYQVNDADGSTRTLQVCAENALILHNFAIDVQTGETGDYDINTDVFTPIVVSGTPTLSQVLIAGNTSGANDIEFDATQGLLFANTSRLREGTIDAGLGGTKGVAQICAVGYELKWEAGRLYVMDGNGLFIRQSLYNFATIPTVTDDVTKGYAVGSLWTLDDGTIYVCSDASSGVAVWAIGGIPTLQQVTDVGSTTTVGVTVDNGAGESINIKHDTIDITNTLGGVASITSPTLTTATTFELPDKASPQTFAMLEDITGTVTSVNSGTNISVDNTDPANPIINSLADRYSTTSVTSNTISNGAKTFTVDANLAYIPLQEVLIVYDPSNHMHATVTSYSGTTLVVNVKTNTGSGTFTSWVLNLDGVPVDAITGVGTVNEIAYFTAGQVIASLAVATYPSLTELALVKGVSGSAIQTQINGKQATLVSGTNIKTVEGSTLLGSTALVVAREIQLACSDETTALTAGTAKVTFRAPRAMVITGVRASLTTAQTSGSIFTVDINDSGTSILSTKLTIDNTEKTSTTAATPPVISNTAIADDAEITIDIDQIGDGTAKGLKVTILYTI